MRGSAPGRRAELHRVRGASSPPAGPPVLRVSGQERGAWSHEFIFVHAFLIKTKSECLWFNPLGASIDFFASGARLVGSVPTFLPQNQNLSVDVAK